MYKIPIKLLDLLILFAWAVGGYFYLVQSEADYLTLIIVSFGVPTLYLLLRNRKESLKVIVASLFLMPIGILVNYFAYTTGSWHAHDSIFNVRFLESFVYEDFLWGTLCFMYILSFYEYFIDVTPYEKRNTTKLAKRAFVYSGILVSALIAIILFHGGLFSVPYYYLVLGVFLSILPVFFIFKYPHLLKKLLEVNIFFFFIFFLQDLATLKLGIWSFPGDEFVGWVTIHGVSLPLEEFVFWICLGASSVVAMYEFFDDDLK